MKLHFKYDLSMEHVNLQCGLGSLNHSGELPKLAQEMIDSGIDLDDKNAVLRFFDNLMKSKNVDVTKKLHTLADEWSRISEEAERRFKKLFITDLDLGEIDVYLTASMRCGYNIEKHFFFVSVDRVRPNKTIIHELFHFYTHKLYEKLFEDNGLSRQQFNDYKEALTVLINSEFRDLLGGNPEKGYDRQRDLRIWIENSWPNHKNVGSLTDEYINLLTSPTED